MTDTNNSIVAVCDGKERSLTPGCLEHTVLEFHKALDERFPDAVNPFHSDPAEPKYIAAIDALIEKHAILARYIEAQHGVNKLSDAALEGELTNDIHDYAMVRTTDECRPLARKVLEALRK